MKIGIYISDAYPPDDSKIQRAVEYLSGLDIQCVFHPDVYKATTASAKAEIIMDYYRDSAIDCLMAFWGGLKTIEILPYLDMRLLKDNPKPISGYSDTTCLLQAISTCTNNPAIHGPALISFAKNLYRDEVLTSFKNALADKRYSNDSIECMNIQSELAKEAEVTKYSPIFYKEGVAQGLTVVGNLQTLLLLNRTKFEMKLANKILFIEEAEEANEDYFRRFLSQLILMSDFSKLNGLVISTFTKYSKVDNSTLVGVLNEYSLEKYDFPIVINYASGHCDPIMSVPLNRPCSISVVENSPSIEFYS